MLQVESSAALSYRTIRRDYQPHRGIEPVLVDHYVKLISPLFTMLFVRAGVIPNVVTLLMMVSGIIGAVLFALPFMAAKIAGIIFIHLWYVLDCSDGEVARITNAFSTFGKEMDFTAHVVCHPLFSLSFAYSLVSMHRFNIPAILFTSLAGLGAEMTMRDLLNMSYIYELKLGTAITGKQKVKPIKAFAIWVTNLFSLYPNFALLFTLAFILDSYLGTTISFWYLLVQSAVSSLVAVRMAIRWIRAIAWA
jgi:phosphatidylglycerophosphate synthase